MVASVDSSGAALTRDGLVLRIKAASAPVVNVQVMIYFALIFFPFLCWSAAHGSADDCAPGCECAWEKRYQRACHKNVQLFLSNNMRKIVWFFGESAGARWKTKRVLLHK
jgi:hypothetical protein